MNEAKERRRVIFLISGVAFAILSATAWIVNWYLPETRLGYTLSTYVALATYLLSLITLIFWMTRLDDEQLINVVLFFLFASLLVYVVTQLIEADYLDFFSFTRELFRGKSIEEYDPRYVMDWGYLFLYPLLYMLNGATVGLSLSAFVVWVIKRMKSAKVL